MENIEKDTKVQDDISQVIEKYNIESDATPSKIGKNALIQSSVFKQAKNKMGVTINDMAIEIEQKDNKIPFLESKKGVTDDKVVVEMNNLNINKYPIKKKMIEISID